MIERTAVRLIVLDAQDSLLLLHTRDLSSATFGAAWELPGGGVEPGESFITAAARELEEETGIALVAGQLSAPCWHRDVEYSYRGEHRLQHEAIAILRLATIAPPIAVTGRVAFEAEDHFEFRWWRREHIACSGERFFPASLPAVLPRLLAGERVVEGLEVWPI